MVGAVEHRKVLPRTELAHALAGVVAPTQTLDTVDQALGFVFFVVGVHHPHRLTLAQLRKQGLGKQLGVGANHVIGRLQNRRGGAVVLFQLHHFQGGKVLRQALQIVQGCTAPAVDGLVVVAHRGESGSLAHQQFQHLVLRGVGVLVFVHQHMAHLLLPLFAYLSVLLQQFQRQANQVIKVHALVGA